MFVAIKQVDGFSPEPLPAISTAKGTFALVVVDFEDDVFSIRATAVSASARCPMCQRPSSVIHSRYWRVLRDLPLQGKTVKLHIQARRFRCRTPDCNRETFVESLAMVTTKHSHQTLRFSETVRLVGYALGGEAGCRLAMRLGIPVSPDTVLRRINRNDPSVETAPKYIGVDDWAWRKGQSNGSILVDLETRQPIDLLADRSADSFACWLKEHPTVQLISRDRAEAYADGARKGAPDAIQVADRFHLLCNLTSAVERVLDTRRSELSKVGESEKLSAESSIAAKTPSKMTVAQERSKQSRDRRMELYSKVLELHKQGQTDRAIGRALHMGRKTVGRFLRAGQFPERAKPHRPGKTNESRECRFLCFWCCWLLIRERSRAGNEPWSRCSSRKLVDKFHRYPLRNKEIPRARL